jgi:hypothetical protein
MQGYIINDTDGDSNRGQELNIYFKENTSRSIQLLKGKEITKEMP